MDRSKIYIIAIVVVVVLVGAAFYYKRASIPTATAHDNNLVIFNSPYEIDVNNLVDILKDLHSITQPEFDLHTLVHLSGTELPNPEIPFEKYFAIDNKRCNVTKFERIKDEGWVQLHLHFTQDV